MSGKMNDKAAAILLFLAAWVLLSQVVVAAEVLVGGDFETIEPYPTPYLHVNAQMQADMETGWGFGEEPKFLHCWHFDTPGTLRISEETPFGVRCVELGRGGEISAAQYRAPFGLKAGRKRPRGEERSPFGLQRNQSVGLGFFQTEA